MMVSSGSMWPPRRLPSGSNQAAWQWINGLPVGPAEGRVGLLDPRDPRWRARSGEVGDVGVIVSRAGHYVAEWVQGGAFERDRAGLEAGFDQRGGDGLVQCQAGRQGDVQRVRSPTEGVYPAGMYRAGLSQRRMSA